MQPNDPPFTLLDEASISAADLRRDPFDFCFVEHAIAETHKDGVLADAPVIPHRMAALACPVCVMARASMRR